MPGRLPEEDRLVTGVERLQLAGSLSRRIDLVTLRLFVAICEEGNLTRAATREGIAASAVSKRLNDLEDVLGVTLFVRLPKGMALTSAGESLLHRARVTLLNVEKIAVELSEYSADTRGHVRLLANLSAIVQFLPEDMSDFFRGHPMLKLDLEERPSARVVRGIEEGRADIGICCEADARELQTFHYRHDRLVIVVGHDHPLGHHSSLSFVDTLDFDHIGLHSASSIYLRSQFAARQAGKSIRLKVHVPGFDAVCRMVQADLGIGLIPERAFNVISEGMKLKSIQLVDSWASRKLRIVVRDSSALSKTGRLMLGHLRTVEEREACARRQLVALDG